MGELRDHRGRLHRLPRPFRADRRRSGGARRQVTAKPFPLPRLRDGRLEPAPHPEPHLGRAARRLSVLGRAGCAEPSCGRILEAIRCGRARRRPDRLRRAARAATRGRVTSAPESPYKGLNAFDDSELDALLFFGREREREIVVANLIASRLTVLYGPSGVGKSSLLRASVARSLRSLPEEPLVVVCSRWSEDPAASLVEAVAEAAGLDSDGSVLEALEQAQTGRDVYLILDQAEEYFLYHADERGPGTFADALPAVVTSPSRVNVLVSLREDSLAKLDRFTGRIPGLFANTLRLDRLDRQAARAAIVRPVDRFNELTRAGV